MLRHILRSIFLCVASSVILTAPGHDLAFAKNGGSKIFDHVYVIVLENHGFDEALNNGSSPFLLSLSRDQGLATRYYGVAHPSLPNYLAMIAGDEFGIRDDNPSCFASDLRPSQSCHRLEGDSLVDQLEAAGRDWALYAESLPDVGTLPQAFPTSEADALYAQKHNPFVYFERIVTNPTRLNKLKPLTALPVDLASKAPNFAFIVPNQCHDGHGLPICPDPIRLARDYDEFVKRTVDMIRASQNWTRNSAIIVTFDEGETSTKVTRAGALKDNQVATIVVTKCGGPATNHSPMNHYALLATIEDGFQLPRLRKAMEAPTFMNLFDRPCR